MILDRRWSMCLVWNAPLWCLGWRYPAWFRRRVRKALQSDAGEGTVVARESCLLLLMVLGCASLSWILGRSQVDGLPEVLLVASLLLLVLVGQAWMDLIQHWSELYRQYDARAEAVRIGLTAHERLMVEAHQRRAVA